MITYQHESYLAEAIESVLAQHLEPSFELIIGVDAAVEAVPDHTLEIALEYQKRFPEVIRVIYSPTNVGMNRNSRRLLLAARGEFLAYCEGDDYWCSHDKLAREYELISVDQSISIVHSDWVKARAVDDRWVVDWKNSVHARMSLSELQGDLFGSFYDSRILRTCTIMIRRSLAMKIETSKFSSRNYKFGDTVYAACATAAGRVGYVPDVTAVYRLSPNSALRSGVDARIAFIQSALLFDFDARCLFSTREDYPEAYRWELIVGLAWWAIRGRDFKALRQAARECKRTYGLRSFWSAAWSTARLRLPALHPRGAAASVAGERTMLARGSRRSE